MIVLYYVSGIYMRLTMPLPYYGYSARHKIGKILLILWILLFKIVFIEDVAWPLKDSCVSES